MLEQRGISPRIFYDLFQANPLRGYHLCINQGETLHSGGFFFCLADCQILFSYTPIPFFFPNLTPKEEEEARGFTQFSSGFYFPFRSPPPTTLLSFSRFSSTRSYYRGRRISAPPKNTVYNNQEVKYREILPLFLFKILVEKKGFLPFRGRKYYVSLDLPTINLRAIIDTLNKHPIDQNTLSKTAILTPNYLISSECLSVLSEIL